MSATANELNADAVSGYFHVLGRSIERRCEAGSQMAERFPDVATQVLAETEVPPAVTPESILRHALSPHAQLERQSDPSASFGQPPITLFRSEHFYIDALYWLDGTTDIHEHRFSGAFRVLAGSSLHAVYDFADRLEVRPTFHLGSASLREAEALRAGDVRPIRSGHEFIHSLFHLERPSVTVVVRTYSDSWTGPQLSYEKAGIGYKPGAPDDPLHKRVQALLTLAELAPDDARRAAEDLIPVDMETAWTVIRYWFGGVGQEGVDDLVAAIDRHYGDFSVTVQRALEERRREQAIISRRRMLRSPDHRLFLALLLNLPDWMSVRSIVSSLFPDDEPEATLARWLTELAAPENRGASGLRLSEEQIRSVVSAIRTGSNAGLVEVAATLRQSPLLADLLR